MDHRNQRLTAATRGLPAESVEDSVEEGGVTDNISEA